MKTPTTEIQATKSSPVKGMKKTVANTNGIGVGNARENL